MRLSDITVWDHRLNFDFRKYELFAVGKRRSQLESHVTEESASHPTSAFEVEMQSATIEHTCRRVILVQDQSAFQDDREETGQTEFEFEIEL